MANEGFADAKPKRSSIKKPLQATRKALVMSYTFRTSVGNIAAPKSSAMRKLQLALAVCGAFAVLMCFSPSSPITVGKAVAAAQEPMSGEWTAEFKSEKPDEVSMMFYRRTKRGGNNMSNTDIPLAELQGLTRAQAFSNGTPVNFRIVREAGTFTHEGYFRESKGSGQWKLSLNESFISTLRGRGYENLREEQLLAAAMHDLNLKFIEDLKAAGYARPPFDELVGARIFNITPDFIREIAALGYERLPLQELVSARIFKVDAAFAREVQEMGFGRQPLEKLVAMRIHKITPDFIREMRALGYENLSIDKLMALRIHGVTKEFLAEIKTEGFSTISPDDAVQLRIFKVNGDFIRRMKARGFSDLTLEQLVQLRIHGIAK